MSAGMRVSGPAIISEDETSTLVSPGWRAFVNNLGYMEMVQETIVMANEMNPLAQIHRQIMWNRLIAVVEEQARIMIRTAFSTTVREAGDLSAGSFDLQGRMMAQAVTGTPGHVNSMAESVGHFLKKFPVETMNPGDHYITNDPWLGTGHLHDLTVVSPAVSSGQDRRTVRQYRARHRYRRPGNGARGTLGFRGRDVYPYRPLLRARHDRMKRFSISFAPAHACRWNWRAISIRCAPATMPVPAGLTK